MEENNHKTILLVEDDKALNRAVTFKIEQKGHKVISTTNGEDALGILDQNPTGIDLVWLDILLPGMNGIEFLEEVRRREKNNNRKVVVCSVSGKADSKGVAEELGVVDYLVKSDYDLNTLVAKVLSYA